MPRPGQAKNRKRKREAEMTSKAVGGVARAAPAWSHQISSIPKGNTLHVGQQSMSGVSAGAEDSGEDYDAVMDGEGIGDIDVEEEYDEDEVDEDEYEEEEEEIIADGGHKEKSKTKKGGGNGVQVLPVADLPDDWEGDIEDGATYLALAMRADKALPTYTRVENPYLEESHGMEEVEDEDEDNGAAVAGPSRHPALPKESWQAIFPLHFVAYKKTIAESWPPSPPLPYPPTWPKTPPTSQRGEWGYYINGHPRKKLPPGSSTKGKAKAVDVDMDEEEGLNGGDDMDMEMDLDEDDEEAAMNLPHDPDSGLEPLGEKHKAREPHICILQKLDTHQIISVLITLTTHIQNTLAPLETDLIPPSYDPLSSTSTYRPHTRKNPYSEHYSRWIYALLLVLDPFLSAEQVSALRELARVVMRVGAWRWVEAVVGGEVGLPASSTGEGEGGERGTWMLGARWKYARDVREANGVAEEEMPRSAKDQIPPNKREEYDETGVDETLARCWLIVHAVAAGWGQKDLVMDLEEMFT